MVGGLDRYVDVVVGFVIVVVGGIEVVCVVFVIAMIKTLKSRFILVKMDNDR